jgi:transcriptional regulator with XRE-family HTH domain
MVGDVFVSPVPLTLGQRIRMARIALRWRQEDLADAALVPQHIVSMLERDLPVYPEAKRRLLAYLGMDGEVPHG